MRKQQLTQFVSMLVLVVGAAAAQTPSQLDRVNVVRSTDDIRVEMSSRGTLSPKLSTLDSPARVVVDLPETVMATGQNPHRGGHGRGQGRAHRHGWPGASDHPHRRRPREGLCLRADAGAGREAGADACTPMRWPRRMEKSKTVAATTPAPASKPMSPFSPRVMDAQSAPKAETTPAAKPTAKDSPTDFVIVEPTYQAKSPATSDAKTDAVADEPTARAQEAAARFSDKTAAELLPVSAATRRRLQSTPNTITPAVNLAAEQKAQSGQQNASVGPKYTGEPISVNLKDVDLKDFFRLIHEISGLNVVLDPNVHGTLTVVLDDVPWDQALDIVLKNNELARELEGNVLRIATVETLKHEADARRAQIESEALAVEKVSVTRFLSYAKAKDVIVTVKKFLSQRGDVVADDRTNAVIINDIPKTIPTIDRLLTQLDRKTQEVEIEARVVAATRQFARDIGTQFGFGWGNGHSAIGGNQAVGSSPTTVSGLTPGYITAAGIRQRWHRILNSVVLEPGSYIRLRAV